MIIAPIDGLCSADMYPIAPNRRATASYLFWAMLGDGFNEEARLASERVAMPKVNRETLADFPFGVPPVEEQVEIVDQIEAGTRAIDSARSVVREQLTKLREYRQSLITAAVTGQIEIEAIGGEAA